MLVAGAGAGVKWSAAAAAVGLGLVFAFTSDNWEGILVAAIAGVPAILIAVGQRRQAARDRRAELEHKKEQLAAEKEREQNKWRVEREAARRDQDLREADRRFEVFKEMIDQLQQETGRLSAELVTARAEIRRLEQSERDNFRTVDELVRGSHQLIGQLETNGHEPVWRPSPPRSIG